MDFLACISRSPRPFRLAIRGVFYPNLPTGETVQRGTSHACDLINYNSPSLHVVDGADISFFLASLLICTPLCALRVGYSILLPTLSSLANDPIWEHRVPV